MANQTPITQEELERIAENDWIRVNPAPLAREILSLRSEINKLRRASSSNEEWREMLGCPPENK